MCEPPHVPLSASPPPLPDVVSADNAAFLCELMDEIGRKDLSEEVKQYVESADGKEVRTQDTSCEQ